METVQARWVVYVAKQSQNKLYVAKREKPRDRERAKFFKTHLKVLMQKDTLCVRSVVMVSISSPSLVYLTQVFFFFLISPSLGFNV